MSSQELGSMMHVSEGIAQLNSTRYKNWNKDTSSEKEQFFNLRVMFLNILC